MKTIRIWGIPIHRIPSDTEFVEKIRKSLRRSRKYVWVYVLMLLVLCVIVPVSIDLAWQLTQDCSDEIQKWIYTGLLLGFLFGALGGQYVFMGVQAFLMALDLFDYNRPSRLLVQYHDRLRQMDALDKDNEQDRPDTTGGKQDRDNRA